ncbi:hypothetical protein T484DRAFT_1811912, partial [Baffinella frigidus]
MAVVVFLRTCIDPDTIFSNLTPGQVKVLAMLAQQISLRAEEVFCDEGDPADSLV